METKNELVWKPTKKAWIHGRRCELNVKVRLNDECKNGFCEFAITCMAYLTNPSSKEDPCIAGGCDHELIGRHFPELKKFFPLHLCTHDGVPMYPVGNGIYHIENSGKDIAMNYLRITEDEFEILSMCTSDETLFKFQLYALGIVDRWKKEADDFITFLEDKCGCKWENPYQTETERKRFVLTDDERIKTERKLKLLCKSLTFGK